ncbi:MAG: glycosyltransferase, partial [Candidatus Staskawiczbacteria bacterium]
MFDYIFITHLPSFYKTNLYNELSKKLKICVIFVGKGSDIRTSDFTAGKINFDYHFLSEASFENRSVIKSLFKLYFLLKKIKYNMIAVGGWELPEFWLTILTSHKKNNALVLESSIEESVHKGLKGFIKKLFLNRLSTVFASGSSQKQLLDQLNYKGSTFITKGVGIINKNTDLKKSSDFNNNFLYVGRLSEEKNLPTLIQVFNNIPEYKLTIVGSGHLEGKLKKLAKPNINFISHVKNDEMYKVYLENDVLVLPSI